MKAGFVLYAEIAALVTLIGIVAKMTPIMRKVNFLLSDWLGEPERPGVPRRPGVMERIGELERKVGNIDYHTGPNHGGSNYDMLIKRLDEISENVKCNH